MSAISEKEKEQLKQEIVAELEEKFKSAPVRDRVGSVFTVIREKWFSAHASVAQEHTMLEVFGSSYDCWGMWDMIRKLTCQIAGCKYVRQLRDVEEANYIAERLCQFIYDLRQEVLERQENANTKK